MPHPRRLLFGLMTLGLLYAAFSGLRTVSDSDLGWQLATGRYVIQQRQIPSHDLFSYTAQGQEWIYPPFSGVIFYLAYLAGGYGALSWLGVAATLATAVLLLLVGGSLGTRVVNSALLLVAVPLVATRTKVRADLFSTLFFAAALVLLWRHYQGRRSPLWLLAPLMLAWANLHLGFVAGLALMAGYLAAELLELPLAGRRAAALARLRRAAPWLVGACLATLLNPWGPHLYVALVRQNRALAAQQGFVVEWFPVRWSSLNAQDVFAWRSPDGAYWWLVAVGALAVGLALWRHRLGPALLLFGVLAASLRYVRFQALYAMVAVVVAPDVFGALGWQSGRREGGHYLSSWLAARQRLAVGAALLAALALVAVRISDLVSDHYYLSVPDHTLSGPGVSWWYPERAASFLLRERLPGRIVNDYNIGGFLTWRLGPQYPVFLDGRAVPFGPDLFYEGNTMFSDSLDSERWQQRADRWGINTMIVSVARYGGLSNAVLKGFCQSRSWRLVYLDEVAAVLVRNRPENAPWLRLESDCAAAQFTPPATCNSAELYNFLVNAGSVLSGLGRHSEALRLFAGARRIFDADPQLYLIRGSALQAQNRLAEAEQDYRTALRLRDSDQAWYALGQVLAVQGRYAEAVPAISRAARRALFPHEIYRLLGELHLLMSQPQEALRAFDNAERHSPYGGHPAALSLRFRVDLAVGRARAWRGLGDLPRAVSFQEQAVRDDPADPQRWRELAELYRVQGRHHNAQQALRRADSLRAP